MNTLTFQTAVNPPLKFFVRCDMKLRSLLLGWSDPDQALRF